MSEEVRNIHINALPVEVSIKVTNEITAKGDPKPSAEVRVTRQLEDSKQVEIIIKGMLKLGVEETSRAVKKALEAEQ